MAYIYPRFYNCSVPTAFLADLPQLAQLCKGSKPPLTSDKRVEQLHSMQGDKFVSFVKSEHYVDGKSFPIFSYNATEALWSFLNMTTIIAISIIPQ